MRGGVEIGHRLGRRRRRWFEIQPVSHVLLEDPNIVTCNDKDYQKFATVAFVNRESFQHRLHSLRDIEQWLSHDAIRCFREKGFGSRHCYHALERGVDFKANTHVPFHLLSLICLSDISSRIEF